MGGGGGGGGVLCTNRVEMSIMTYVRTNSRLEFIQCHMERVNDYTFRVQGSGSAPAGSQRAFSLYPVAAQREITRLMCGPAAYTPHTLAPVSGCSLSSHMQPPSGMY